MRNMIFIFMAVLALFPRGVSAAEVDATAAQAVAERFMKSQASSGKLMNGGSATLRLAHAVPADNRAGAMDYYVFNTSDESAFVIIAGDDRAEQVLGYGNGAFDAQNIPCNLKWWLDQYKEQIEFLRTQPDTDAGVPRRAKRSPAEDLVIEPLLTCQWSQEQPFNDQCPKYNGSLCVTGCIATAMAQVMYYWKYPDELPALQSYKTVVYGFEVPALPGTTLDWDHMIDVYKQEKYTSEEGEAVATLMRYCGQACYMEYSPEGSGSSEMEQHCAFVNFGYNPLSKNLYRDEVNDDDLWNAMILEDLQAGRPIAYCGSTEAGGHAFVLDGYKDGKYHVNWGWGGYADGYFTLDALGISGYAFNYYQSMIHGVYPNPEGDTSPAYDFEDEGFYYNLKGNEAELTYRDARLNSYSGHVVIPSEATYNGETFPVTSIGEYAFMNSTALESVSIPNSVKRIGRYAFMRCDALTRVDFGNSLVQICDYAFYDCDAILSLDIPGTMASLGMGSFTYCDNLQSVTIADGVGRIGPCAFAFCQNLNTVEFKGKVGNIEGSAFWECSNLENLTLPTSVDTIGYAAFAYCEKLPSVTFYDTRYVEQFAFYGATSLEEVTFAGQSREFEMFVFNGCGALSRVNVLDLTSWCAMNFTDGASNPLYVAENLYVDGVLLEDLVIPDGVTSIGKYVFNEATRLNSVTFPASLQLVSESAFKGCANLSFVNALDLAMWCAIDFTDITSNPLIYSQSLYVDGTKVEDLEIPAGVTSVGKNAFVGATSLNSVAFPASLRSVGASAFKGCSNLTVVKALDLASWCGITFGNVDANPLSVSHHLSVDGKNLQELVIPAGVESIGDYAFYACEDLTKIAGGDDLQSVGDFAFQQCKNLAEVKLGDAVKSIGEKAFSTCTSLKDITLGQGLESIGSKAFTSCMVISNISCKAMTPPALADKGCFVNGVYKKATVSVPGSALADYQAASSWGQFANIVEGHFDRLVGDVNLDGEITIADVNAVISRINDGTPGLDADVNGDGEVNVADINAVVNLILESE